MIEEDDNEIAEVVEEISSETEKTYLVKLREVVVTISPLGLIAFGGPSAHIGLLHDHFVKKLKWLDNDKFVELLAVCQGLPGPSSTQMVTAIAAVHAGVFAGILAFFIWNSPSFIILVIVAIASRDSFDSDKLPDFLSGLPAAAICLVFFATYNLGSKILLVDTAKGEELYVQQ